MLEEMKDLELALRANLARIDEIESSLKHHHKIVVRLISEIKCGEAVCSARYHLLLAEKGDTRCGVCGSPIKK